MATTVDDDQVAAARRLRPGRGRAPGAAAGIAAAAVALGVAQLGAGLIEAVPSPVVAVGGAVVDRVPPAVRDAAISTLGTWNKPALIAGMLAVIGLVAGGLGVLARRSLALAVLGLTTAGGLGLLATAGDPQADLAGAAAVLGVSVAAGAATLGALLARLPASTAARPATPARRPRAPDDPPAFDRRAFARLALGAGAVAAASAAGGQLLTRRAAVRAQPAGVALPGAAVPLGPPPPDLAGEVTGVSPLFTPNEDFYRIDTALSVPRVDAEHWRLRIDGLVERPFELTYRQLLDEQLVEADATLVCVSNEVGGRLVGNARWIGVPLATLLERAGVDLTATQVVGRSVDGWTAGFPTAVARDGRNALVAVGMNGQPLPAKHGFPARLVVPGLYGYVSATKWLEQIELTTWDGFDAYWVPRGWAKEGPVKTQCRIDVPRNGATVAAGPTAVAGVAWAQPRGIARVEVQADDGPWREAALAPALHADTWRQWRLRWDAEPGRHTLRVRATDGEGDVQVAIASPPQPDGATGLHAVGVRVEAG